jgi:hypothetical protein
VYFRSQRSISAINGAKRHHKEMNDVSNKEKFKGLQKNILNSARNVFDDHTMCSTTGNYYCKKEDHLSDQEKSYNEDSKQSEGASRQSYS